MKLLKALKIFIALFLIIGAVIPIISTLFFDGEHRTLFIPISFVSSFVGVGLMFGFDQFRTLPKQIGNLDNTPVKINQAWMVFFISLVITLLVANLCGI